jgi:hypothetical protein
VSKSMSIKEDLLEARLVGILLCWLGGLAGVYGIELDASDGCLVMMRDRRKLSKWTLALLYYEAD